MKNTNNSIGIEQMDRVLVKSSICFAISIHEIFWPLLYGGTIVISNQGDEKDPVKLLDIIERYKINLAFFIPSLFNQVLKVSIRERLSSIKKIICMGESFDKQVAREFNDLLPDSKIYNGYGMTEIGGFAMLHQCSENDEENVPIGMCTSEVQAYVLNENKKPVKDGECGNLYVGGDCLCSTYFNMEEEFKNRCINNAELYDNILFDTNDLILKQGKYYYYKGRTDTLVKIRGNRIELLEIEKTILSVHGIKDAAVIADNNTNKKILAFIVKNEDYNGDIIEGVKSVIRNNLAEYMYPNKYVIIDEMPNLPNGKKDRNKLLNKYIKNSASKDRKKIQTPIEKFLIFVYTSVLNCDEINVEDNFFENGGDSIEIMETLRIINEVCGVNISLNEFIKDTRIKKIENLIIEKQHNHKEYKKLEFKNICNGAEIEEKPFDLTELQESYLFDRNSGMNMCKINTSSYVELNCKDYDQDKFISSVIELINRQHALTIRFTSDNRQAFYKNIDISKFLEQRDFRNMSSEEIVKQLEISKKEVFKNTLDAKNSPLFKIISNIIDENNALIQIFFDGLIVDGRSINIFINDLGMIWKNNELFPETFSHSFCDFIKYKKLLKTTPEYIESKNYWKNKIDSMKFNLELPLIDTPDKVQSMTGCQEACEFTIDEYNLLCRIAAEFGVSPFVTMLTIFCNILSKWNRKQEFVICIPHSERPDFSEEFKYMIGEYSNFILFDFKRNENESFIEMAEKNQQKLWAAKANSIFTGTELLREIDKINNNIGTGIVPIVFTSILDDSIFDNPFKINYIESHTSNIYLDVVIQKVKGKIHIGFNYIKELVDGELIANMVYDEKLAVKKLIHDKSSWNEPLIFNIPQKHKEIIETVNNTEKEFQYRNLGNLISENFTRYHDRYVLETIDKKMTYAELKNHVVKFADYLKNHGGYAGQPVCILLEKGINQVIAVLGCLWLGIPYMPLEEDIPSERLKKALNNSKCRIIVCSQYREIKENCTIINIDEVLESKNSEKIENLEPFECCGEDLAVIIHTSGSTGDAKAVMVQHKGLLNCLEYTISKFGITNNDTAIALTNLAHDMSMFDIFGMIMAGGKIAFPDSRHKKDPLHWIELMDKCKVTIWNSVPAIMDMLLTYAEINNVNIENKLRLVILGGDYLTLSIPERIWNLYPSCRVVNVGGPTETTLWNIYHIVSRDDIKNNLIPYGVPIQNTKYHILNDFLEEVPIGVTGHLYCSGICVTKGYLGNDEMTKERYVMNSHKGIRMYNTGDLGRYLPNGEIEFMGREDFQIKINGKRIELNEIERAVLSYGNINSCYACCNTERKEIIAFYMSERIQDSKKIKEYISDYIPIYMIPKDIVHVNEVPHTINSKVDKKLLIENYYVNKSEDIIDKKEMNNMEKKIYELFEEVLESSSFSKEDNFLIIGGDSLKAIKLVNLIENRLLKRISIVEFFEHSSVKLLAEYILDKGTECDIKRENEFIFERDKKYEEFNLSELQQAYLVGRKTELTLGCVSTHGYLELETYDYDHRKFLRILNKLIERHEMLRCEISYEGMQHFVKEIKIDDIPFNDISSLNEQEQKKYLDNVRNTMIKYVLDLKAIPLARIQVTRVTEQRHIIHFYFDTIIIDGYSYELLCKELDMLYADENLELKKLEITFRDYIRYKEYLKTTEKYKEAKEYWMDRIPSLPEPATLPLLCDPSSINKIEGVLKACKLTMEEYQCIEKEAGKRNLSTFIVLFTAFSKVILKWNYKKIILLNIPKFDRPQFHPDINNIVGECSTFILFEAEKIPGETFFETCIRNQKQLLEAEENSLFTGMEVLREIYKYKNNYGNGIVPIVFSSILDFPEEHRNIFKTIYTETHTSQVWIDIDAQRCNNEIQFNWNCVKGLFDEEMLDDMVNMQMDILKKAAFSEEFWDEKEEEYIPERDMKAIQQINNTEKKIEFESLSKMLNDAFDRFEENTAIVCSNEEYSYRQLKKLVINAVSVLNQNGVESGGHVALFMDKSIEQVVYVLACVYIGAVYVPIEYECPYLRLKNIIENTDCRHMVSTSNKKDEIKELKTKIIYSDENRIEYYSNVNMHLGNEDDVFAIIHTSGSTGNPKAVLVQQKGIVNCIKFTNTKFEINENDSVLSLTNFAHDMSMFDMFGMLVAGGKVVLPDSKSLKDPLHWISLIKKYNITIWNSVPAMLQMLIEVMDQINEKQIPSYRMIISGGDYFGIKLAKNLMEKAPGAKLISVGGPTETTLWNIYHEITIEDINKGVIPYGRPIDNTKYYVLDENLNKLPIGVTGKLYASGAGVTKGYYKDKQSTDKKYIMYRNNEIIYDTGDMGRYLKNGEIEFMGREDFQVKINGKRIELGEIESILNEYPGIKLSIAKISKDNKTIYAYYKSDSEYDSDILKEYILNYLPSYMLPKYILRVDEFPLSRTNKIDRTQLPEIQEAALDEENNSSLTESERKLLDIAMEILKTKNISMKDSFFLSGGDSLQAIKFSGEIKKQFNIEYSLTELFERPCFYQILQYINNAEHIQNSQSKEEKNTNCDDNMFKTLELSKNMFEHAGDISYGQEGIYIHEMFYHSNIFTLTGITDIYGNIDKEIMKKALNDVIECNDVLRMNIVCDDDFNPVAVVKKHIEFNLRYIELDSKQQIEKELEDLKEKEISIEDSDNLFEFELWKTGDDKYKLIMRFHHIISDEGSFGIFINDLKKAYNYYLNKNRGILKNKEKHFYDYAYLERNSLDKEEICRYWRDVLKGQKFIDVPGAKERKYGPDTGRYQDINLNDGYISDLEKIFKNYDATMYIGFLVLFMRYVSIITKEQNICVGTPVSLRQLYDMDDVMGLFVNETVICNKISSEETFDSSIKKVRKTTAEALTNSLLPFETIIRELNMDKDMINLPFHIHFNYIDEKCENEDSKDILRFDALDYVKNMIQHNFGLYVERRNKKTEIKLTYKKSYISDDDALKYADGFKAFVQGFIKSEKQIL